jgi:WD40 repeat protein
MLSSSQSHDRRPVFFDVAGSTSFPSRSVRLAILSLLSTGLLCAIVVTLLVLAVGPASTDESPAWSFRAGHLVRALAFARDSRRLATGGDDGSVVIWELGKNAEKALSHDSQSSVVCVAFSPDGSTLAVGCENFTCVLLDLTTEKKRTTLTGHTNAVMCLDFSPDGVILATGGADSTIRVWDVASGKTKATLVGHPGAVHSIRFTPDGRTLASKCRLGLVKLWDVSSGKCRESIGPGKDFIPALGLAFSPDGSTLAYIGACGNLILRDVETGRERVVSQPEGAMVQDVVFSADGQMLIHKPSNGSVHVREISARHDRTIRLGNFLSRRSVFSSGGSILAMMDMDGTLSVWDLSRISSRKSRPSLSAQRQNQWILER